MARPDKSTSEKISAVIYRKKEKTSSKMNTINRYEKLLFLSACIKTELKLEKHNSYD
jgi:hypothetical protein